MLKFCIKTFGCKVNQYESQELVANFCNMALSLTSVPDNADIYIVNSCAVTSRAEQECRQFVRGIARKNKNAKILITGCYATRAPDEIKSIAPGIQIYANQDKEKIPGMIERCWEKGDCPPKKRGQSPFSQGNYEQHYNTITQKHYNVLKGHLTRQRALLKVQDGCNAACTYCIIPFVRPGLWSKPVENVINEVKHLLSQGYAETVLTGIRLGLYKSKTDNLVSLLRKIISIEGHFRIRLSSLEVTEVKDELIDLIKNNAKICRHLHIPLQSGDDKVLKDMGRLYTAGYFMETVNKVRASLPDCGVTSDVIVGFPTESDEAFKNTVDTVKKANLSGLHVFRFSPRPGTKATGFKPLAVETVRRRATLLLALAVKQNKAFHHLFKGAKREILVESSGYGWTDNYIRVKTPKSSDDYGKLVYLPIT